MPRGFVVLFAIAVSLFACGQVVLSIYGLVHHDYLTAVLNAIGCGINFNVLYGAVKTYRGIAIAEANRARRANEMAGQFNPADPAGIIMRQVSSMFDTQSIEKAQRNLEKIVRAVGAKQMGSSYILETKKGVFNIHNGHVYRKHNNRFSGDDGTCYHVGHHMPPAELIGTALLLLHHDPTLYEKWVRQDGYYR